MNALLSPPETSVNFYRNAQHFIPEDSTLHNHRCEELKDKKDEVFPVLKQLSTKP
jgi:hypothetical protein